MAAAENTILLQKYNSICTIENTTVTLLASKL